MLLDDESFFGATSAHYVNFLQGDNNGRLSNTGVDIDASYSPLPFIP